MAIKLTSTRESATNNGVKILVYGQAGAGKTCLAATTGGTPLLISAEAGLLSLRHTDIAVAEIKTIQDLEEVYQALATNHPDFAVFDWICIDSISEIAEVVLSSAKSEVKDPRQAYGILSDEMQKLIRKFRDLPRNVYVSAKQERLKDEESGRLMYQPSAPGTKLGQSLPYFFDEVFAYRVDYNLENPDNTARYLQTQPCHNYMAKDRSGVLNKFEEPNLALIAEKIRNN